MPGPLLLFSLHEIPKTSQSKTGCCVGELNHPKPTFYSEIAKLIVASTLVLLEVHFASLLAERLLSVIVVAEKLLANTC